jgi:hypothetical protein
LIQLSTFCALSFAVGRNLMIIAKRTYTDFGPCVVAARSLARSIQDASDPLIRHLSGELPDDIRGRLIQGPASFTVTCFAHFELGVIASLPMNHQIDLVAVDASDDFNNDGA